MAVRKPIPLGTRFTRLVVIKSAPPCFDWRGYPRFRVVCKCQCGNIVTVWECNLRTRHVRSCGCLRSELTSKRFRLHGHRVKMHGKRHRSAEYQTWQAMIERCFNTNNRYYHGYGGRGIKVHNPWRKDFRVFLRYLKRYGLYPRPQGHSIDRIDNDGNYEPGNIRWATPQQQSRNRRRRRSTRAVAPKPR